MNNYFHNKKIWITGASKGIGRAMALEFARRGAHVAVSARNTNALEDLVFEIGEENAFPIVFDVTDKRANQVAVNTIRKKWQTLDIAFFNAGTAEYIDIQHFNSDVFERVMRTNFLSIVYGIEAVLPLLRMSSDAQLGGMSSTVSFAGLPRGEAYGASKAAVRNMLQGLRVHLKPENIDVFTVCPGFVKTPLTDKNNFPMPLMVTAEKAAEIIINGIARRKAEIHFPKAFSLPYKMVACLPSGWYSKLMSFTVRHT